MNISTIKNLQAIKPSKCIDFNTRKKENNANDRNRRTGNRTENIPNDQRKRKIRKQETKYMDPFLIAERTQEPCR